jgi:hypothetical protein
MLGALEDCLLEAQILQSIMLHNEGMDREHEKKYDCHPEVAQV